MRPAEFSPEEIVAAGEALVAAGRNVTGFALRQKVGGGNPNRLTKTFEKDRRQKGNQHQCDADGMVLKKGRRKRILDNMRCSIRRRQCNCNNKIGRHEAEQDEDENFTLPPGQ